MAKTLSLSFIHRFEKGAEPDAPPLLLLHGTGGDENDLIPLGRMIAPTAPLLSPRGKVLENGMPRFFRRFAEGRFDEDDISAAFSHLGPLVTRFPHSQTVRYHLGLLLTWTGQRAQAVKEFTLAVQLGPRTTIGHEAAEFLRGIARKSGTTKS